MVVSFASVAALTFFRTACAISLRLFCASDPCPSLRSAASSSSGTMCFRGMTIREQQTLSRREREREAKSESPFPHQVGLSAERSSPPARLHADLDRPWPVRPPAPPRCHVPPQSEIALLLLTAVGQAGDDLVADEHVLGASCKGNV